MQWAALIAWFLTASGGSALSWVWIRHGGVKQPEGLRPARLLTHILLAGLGLASWIVYVLTDSRSAAWISIALLALVAIVGLSMLAISLRGRTRTTRTAAPAEAMFPLPLVVGHGALAGLTLVLSLVSVLSGAT
jgi:hypothetical protein